MAGLALQRHHPHSLFDFKLTLQSPALCLQVEMAGLTLDDIDVYEINEAFASQVGGLQSCNLGQLVHHGQAGQPSKDKVNPCMPCAQQ